MTRQLGAALGVSVLVAIVGGAGGPAAIGAFHRAWGVMLGAALLAAALASLMGRVHMVDAPAAAPAPA